MFLSEPELEKLTGYKRGKYQCKWFTEKKIPFLPDASGKPAVSKELINKILGVDTINSKNQNEPDEAALKALMNRKKKK